MFILPGECFIEMPRLGRTEHHDVRRFKGEIGLAIGFAEKQIRFRQIQVSRDGARLALAESEVCQSFSELWLARKGNGDWHRMGLITLPTASERSARWVRLDEERKFWSDGGVENQVFARGWLKDGDERG